MGIHSLSFMGATPPLIPRCIDRNRMKSDKYHLIIEAAITVFAKQGYYQTTVAQIAREAGVADGTIYLYFKNKEDILLQIFSFRAKQIFDQFYDAVATCEHSEEKLRSLIRNQLEAFQQDKGLAVVFQAESRQVRKSDALTEQINQISKQYRTLIGEIVEKGQDEGCMRKDLYLGLVKRFILGAVEEVINTWVLAGGRYDLASMADPLVDLYMRGIGIPKQ